MTRSALHGGKTTVGTPSPAVPEEPGDDPSDPSDEEEDNTTPVDPREDDGGFKGVVLDNQGIGNDGEASCLEWVNIHPHTDLHHDDPGVVKKNHPSPEPASGALKSEAPSSDGPPPAPPPQRRHNFTNEEKEAARSVHRYDHH